MFYPDNLPREEYLSFYAEHFNALELFYTYHVQPTSEEFFYLRRRSVGKIKFSLVANKELTNEVKVSKWRTIAKELRKSLYPLVNENLLLGLTFLFPPSFTYEEDNRRYLANLLNEFTDILDFIEFQHQGWFTKRVYEGLERRKIGLCLCDKPSFSRFPSYVRTNTRNVILSETGYIRLQNELLNENQTGKVIHEITGRKNSVNVFFCQHTNGYAVLTAQKLKKAI